MILENGIYRIIQNLKNHLESSESERQIADTRKAKSLMKRLMILASNGWPIKNEGLDIWLISRSIFIAHSRTHS